MTSKEIYQSIDQSKISPKGKDFLQKAEKSTKGFTIQNDKLDSVMKKLYADLKAKKPEALKDVKTKTVETEVKVPTTKAEQKKEPKKTTKTVKQEVKKATGKKKNTKPTKTPSTPKEGKKEHISTRAKKLADKEGISFKEARARLSKEAKEQIKKDEKEANKELDKLLKFVRKDSFEDGEKYPKIYGKQDPKKSSLSADAKRMAKPVGKRVSKNGKTYYEYRDNRSDRNSLPTKEGYKYKGKTPPYLEAGGTLPTPFGQAGLVGETGAMNEMDMFAMGGDLPQGVHQYYANTYNPAYPIPHGYAKGGMVSVEYYSDEDEFEVGEIESFKTEKEAIAEAKKVFDAKDYPYIEVVAPNGEIIKSFGKRNFAKGGSIKVGDKVKYPKATMVGKVKSIKDLGFEKELTIEYDDGKIIKEGESSVIKLAKGGEIDAFIMKFIKDAPSSNLKVDAEKLTAKLKKGGKLGRSKHSLMQDRRRVSSESWEVAYQKRKKNKMAKGGMTEKEKLDEAIKHFEDKIKKQGRITNAFDEKHLSSLKELRKSFAKGGEVIEYSKVYEILKEKIDDAVEDIESTYEQATNTKGEEVEYKSRDGFIPFTNGGYSSRWFEYSNMLEGSGMNLPTASLDEKIEEFRERNREYGFERFEEEYPEIVEELGGIENVNYSELYDAGYGSEAEELDEFMRDDDDTVMMEVEAFYYTPNNDRGENGKHTIQLSGVVNLEAPYHRSGNLEDYVEERFTFDSYKELEDKLDKGLAKVVSWFEGDMYDKNPRELKIRRMEAGGTLPTPFGQAGLVGETGAMNEMDMFAMGGGLPQGVHQYYANTYNPAYPTPHGYAKGGMLDVKIIKSKKFKTKEEAEKSLNKLKKLSMYDKNGKKIILKNLGIDKEQDGYIASASFLKKDYRLAKGGYIVEDGKVMLNGNKIGSYQFDRDSNSFWIYDGVKDRNFEEKEDIIDYFENRNFAKGGMIYSDAMDDFFEEFKNAEKDNLIKSANYYSKSKKGSVAPIVIANKLRKYFIVKKNRDGLVKEIRIDFYDESSDAKFKYSKKYAKGGKTQGGKFQVALHWKGLSKDRTIGKYIITEKTLDELEEQWSHIVSIDVLDNSNKKPISWFELKKELYSKGRDKGLYAKGGKTQGYNDKLDESLGNTKGKRSTKEQNYKDRRNESEAMEKKGGKRKYARVKTMDKGNRKKKMKTPMTLAKAIRREGEKWQDAVKRASAMIRKDS